MPDTDDNARDDELLILRREVDNSAVVVHAIGEVDLSNAGLLSAELTSAAQDASGRLLVLDMSRVSFVSSSGVAVLVEHQQQARQARSNLRIVASGNVVARTLQRTGLLELLALHATLADALAAGSPPPRSGSG